MGGRLNNKAYLDLEEDEDLQLEMLEYPSIRIRSEIARKGRARHRHVRTRSMFQLVPSSPLLILLPVYLALLSQFGTFVEANTEIESCSVQTTHSSTGTLSSSSSSSATVSANGLGYYSSGSVQNNGGSVGSASGLSGGAPGAGGGGGGTNNGFGNHNEPSTTSAVVDPHSVILCNIRTLHPDLDMENLTSSVVSTSGGNGGVGGGGTSMVQNLDTNSIRRLKLVCNDVLFFESAVTPGQLRSLSELRELTIDKCKLKHIPSEFLSGLRHLRNLTINTGNSDWAARSLELSPGALQDVPRLRHLHLGFNHMWNIPEGLLCSLGLSSLNLTSNLFSDINDLGLPGRPALGSIKNSAAEYDLNSQDSSLSSSGSSSSSCLSELKSLDISSNTIRNLGSRRLENLKRLQELRVQQNWLEELEDDALYGLVELKSLNLSSNRLVALPPKLFQPCKGILKIDLKNNSLAALSPGLLENLEHLEILDLSMNSLSSQWITANEFKSLVRLVILNMAHNQLTHLGPSTFQNLYTVQVLDLQHNLISSIADGTFAPMSNLHSLNLSKNRLITISNNMFNGLYVLHKLILDYNEITQIELGAMKNCTSLQDLGLVGNSLQDVPQALRGLQLLKTLDLGENKIQSLNNESFLGMGQLIGLRMVDNQLEEIPKGMCDPITRLRVFNVAQNKIHKINSHAFHSCPELKVLRLDSNNLEMIPPTLAPQLPNLLWLNISENSITRVDYTLLPQTLEWLDVSHNQLESLGGAWSSSSSSSQTSSSSGSPSPQALAGNNGNKNNILINNNNNNLVRGKGNLNGLILHNAGSTSHHSHHVFTDHHNARLRVVDASHNKIAMLDHHAIPPQIEVLRLSHNHLKKIAPDTFGRSANLRRVELIGNQLENLPLSALRFPPVPQGKPLPEFFIGGNPLLCNCEMEYLTRINQLSSLRQHPMVLDLDAIVCRLEYSRTITYVPLPDIKPQDFLCPYKSHCFALCHCCEFDACDCAMLCPGNCTCYHDDTWTANVVNCARSGHSAIPSRLPMDSTEVYLDGNTIPTLKSHTFIGRKNLRILFLNSSSIETISNKSFNGLQSLSVLHLENNALRALHGYEFDHLTRLRELYLNDNKISSIHNATFLPLKSLEILRLDGNRLVMFTVWQLSLNPYLVEVGLARNEWNCECHFLHQLYGWITDNSRKVIDLIELQCVWNTTHKPGPHLIDYNRTCGSSWALMGYENGFDLTTLSPLSLALVFVSLVTLLILVVALVIICRENLSLWLFTKFNGFRLCALQDYEDDKSYDSYLIYSQKDEEFVAQRIADELETNDNYRLCLHYRDLICESGDLKEMMIGAVENSKSVLIILSRNFLQGEWSSGEYRSAFHAVLKKSQRGGGGLGRSSSSKVPPKKILIVFIEDIPKVEINPDIRSWVRHNKIQVIKWNIHSTDYSKNRRFWNKLKFSLPDPSSHYHSNITSNTTTTSASSGDGHHHGGIMTTLKYQTTMQGDSHLHHPISYSPHSNNTMVSTHNSHHNHHHNNHNHQNTHNHHHHQIIVDESGKYSTTPASSMMLPSSHNGTLQNSPKYWAYGPTNFVALPPKYQQSHHSTSSSSGGSHPPSVNSPGSAQSTHYHPPLPTSNPPKSPPSSQSTDSTTTTMADDAPSLMSQLTMASYNNGPALITMNMNSATKSPVPVPKSSYSSTNSCRNNILNSPIVTSGNNSTSVNNGESYLSIDGEHVYSTLDPPSPQPIQPMSLSQNISSSSSGIGVGGNSTGATNFLNSIHLPNGYTYQPQSTLNHHLPPPTSTHNNQQHHQWQNNFSPSPNNSSNAKQLHQVMSSFSPNSTSSSPASSSGAQGGSKGFKLKDVNNPVQTYLV